MITETTLTLHRTWADVGAHVQWTKDHMLLDYHILLVLQLRGGDNDAERPNAAEIQKLDIHNFLIATNNNCTFSWEALDQFHAVLEDLDPEYVVTDRLPRQEFFRICTKKGEATK